MSKEKSIVKFAKKYIKKGFNLVKVYENSKIPSSTISLEDGGKVSKKGKNGKNDTVELQIIDKKKQNEIVIEYLTETNGNYSLVMGDEFIGVDIDLKDHYEGKGKDKKLVEKKEDIIIRWEELKNEMPETMMRTLIHKTTTNGLHLIFKQTEYSKKQKIKEKNIFCDNSAGLDGYIDIRAGNGFLVGVGSKIDKKEYEILNKAEILDVPDELIDKLFEYKKPKKEDEKTNNKINEDIDNNINITEDITNKIKNILGYKFEITMLKLNENGYVIEGNNNECFVNINEEHSSEKSRLYINRDGTQVPYCVKCGPGKSVKNKRQNNQIINLIEVKEIEIISIGEVEYHDEINTKYLKGLKCIDDQVKYMNQYLSFIEDSVIYIYTKKNGETTTYTTELLLKWNKPIYKELNKWMEHDDRKKYDKMDFIPDIKKCPSNVYNIFKGFNIVKNYVPYKESEKEELLKPSLDHFKNFFNEEGVFEYVMKWIGHIFQYPTERKGTALCLRSKPGTGKNQTIGIIGKMIGKEYYSSDANPKSFLGDHSIKLKGKILVNPNEFKAKDGNEFSEQLKSLITDETMTINPKFIQEYEINLFLNWIFSTNNTDGSCLLIEEDDRRYVVIDVSDYKRNNRDFYRELNQTLTMKHLSALYDYFMSLDVKTFDWSNERPITQGYKDMKESCVPTTIKYLVDKINNTEFFSCNAGSINKTALDKDGKRIIQNEIELSGTEFIKGFIEWAKDNNYKNSLNATSFGKFMKKIPGITTKRSGSVAYTLNRKEIMKYLKEKKYME